MRRFTVNYVSACLRLGGGVSCFAESSYSTDGPFPRGTRVTMYSACIRQQKRLISTGSAF